MRFLKVHSELLNVKQEADSSNVADAAGHLAAVFFSPW
jgi:hypothetical protein